MAHLSRSLSIAAILAALFHLHYANVARVQLNFSVLEEAAPASGTSTSTSTSTSASVANLVTELRRRGREVASCTSNNEYFQVSASGELQVVRRLDREALCPHLSSSTAGKETRLSEASQPCVIGISVICMANDSAVFVKISITVSDINDNAPSWPDTRYEVSLAESTGSGSQPQSPTQTQTQTQTQQLALQSVRVPLARDADAGRNGQVQYVLSGPDRLLFQLLPRSDAIVLQLKTAVDREQKDVLRVVIEAHDLGSPTLNSSLEVLVHVLDVNDHAPQFINAPYRIAVAENLGIGTVIFTLQAVDSDAGANGRVIYRFSELADATARQLFHVDESSGQVSLAQRLDYESNRVHELHLVAIDGGSIPQTCETILTVNVTDVNDNAVTIKFTPSSYVTELRQRDLAECGSDADLCVEENVKAGTWLATVFADDRDADDNDRITCRSETLQFVLEPLYPGSTREFNFSVARYTLDREVHARHVAIITCFDNGHPSLSSTRTLMVDVTDVNDNAPRFENSIYNVSVAENNPKRLELLQLRATDSDANENARLTYSLHPNDTALRRWLEIDDRGRVLATASFDRELVSSLRFRALAIDSGRLSEGSKRLSATATIDLFITDVNDVPPKFEQPEYTFTIEEHSVGLIGHVAAFDADADSHRYAHVTYRLAPPSVAFSADAQDDFRVDADSGRIYARKQFDREQQADYHFAVLAIDNPFELNEPQLTATVAVHVVVTDINDNAPVFAFPNLSHRSLNVSYFAPVRSRIARVEAFDADFAENATISYSMRHLGFEIDKDKEKDREKEKDPVFAIDKQSGEITLLRSFQSLHKLDASRNYLHRLYIFAHDGGDPPREASQSLDIIVFASNGKLQEELETTKSGSVLNHPVILVSLLILLALIFLILLIVVLTCAFNRKCFVKHTRDRRRPKELISNPDQERQLIHPVYADNDGPVTIHCVNGTLSRNVVNQIQNYEFHSEASAPADFKENNTYGFSSHTFESSARSRPQSIINTSPSFNVIRRHNIDFLRQSNTVARSCPTSPPPDALDVDDDDDDDDNDIYEEDEVKHQSALESEMRAFAPKSVSNNYRSANASHERAATLRTIYQPATVNLNVNDSGMVMMNSKQCQMHTFPRGKVHSASASAAAAAAAAATAAAAVSASRGQISGSDRSTIGNLSPIHAYRDDQAPRRGEAGDACFCSSISESDASNHPSAKASSATDNYYYYNNGRQADCQNNDANAEVDRSRESSDWNDSNNNSSCNNQLQNNAQAGANVSAIASASANATPDRCAPATSTVRPPPPLVQQSTRLVTVATPTDKVTAI